MRRREEDTVYSKLCGLVAKYIYIRCDDTLPLVVVLAGEGLHTCLTTIIKRIQIVVECGRTFVALTPGVHSYIRCC